MLQPSEERIYRKGEDPARQVLRARGQEGLYADWRAERAEFLRHRGAEEGFYADPLRMRDMERALAALAPLIAERRRILVYGDYDCDGLTATALVIRFLRALGVPCEYLIPDRLTEGYGLSAAGLAQVLERRPAGVLTVDCGVQSLEEVAAMKAAGLVVVVTDHHVCGARLPEADAVLNPNRPGEDSGVGELSGAGVALKLCQALNRRFGRPGLWREGLQLAALGTVADMMPLLGENRRLVMAGLEQLRKEPLPGMAALLSFHERAWENLRARTLSFSLAPRLNACGRVSSPAPAMKLLLSESREEGLGLAREIEGLNEERRRIEAEVTEKAVRFLGAHPAALDARILLLYGEDWHAGVLGIAATRITRLYRRPAVLLARDAETGLYKGSARSVGQVDILACLRACAPQLHSFGGHAAAAGLAVEAARLDELGAALAAVGAGLRFAADEGEGDFDLAAPVAALDLPLLAALELLEPTGKGNPPPRFRVPEARVVESRRVGAERAHLRLSLGEPEPEGTAGTLELIAFSQGELAERLPPGALLAAEGELEKNSFRGADSPQLKAERLWPLTGGAASDPSAAALALQAENGAITAAELAARLGLGEAQDYLPGPEALVGCYRALVRRGLERGPILLEAGELPELLRPEHCSRPELAGFIAENILRMYVEGGFLRLMDWPCQAGAGERYRCCHLQSCAHKVNLYETPHYRRLKGEPRRP